jgi:histone H3/H4
MNSSTAYNMSAFENDETSLPKGRCRVDPSNLLFLATLTQIIKDFLPEGIRMSQQTSDLIIQLAMHFLNYLSDTSNNVCNGEGKKTITPSHVVRAL